MEGLKPPSSQLLDLTAGVVGAAGKSSRHFHGHGGIRVDRDNHLAFPRQFAALVFLERYLKGLNDGLGA
jgi:hypothetical protein